MCSIECSLASCFEGGEGAFSYCRCPVSCPSFALGIRDPCVQRVTLRKLVSQSLPSLHKRTTFDVLVVICVAALRGQEFLGGLAQGACAKWTAAASQKARSCQVALEFRPSDQGCRGSLGSRWVLLACLGIPDCAIIGPACHAIALRGNRVH